MKKNNRLWILYILIIASTTFWGCSKYKSVVGSYARRYIEEQENHKDIQNIGKLIMEDNNKLRQEIGEMKKEIEELKKDKDKEVVKDENMKLYVVEEDSLRSEPEYEAERIQVLMGGTAVKVEKSKGDWYYVRAIFTWGIEGKEGWIKKEMLGELEELLNHRKNDIETYNSFNLFENLTISIREGAEDLDSKGMVIDKFQFGDIGRIIRTRKLNGERIFDIELSEGILLSTTENFIDFIE